MLALHHVARGRGNVNTTSRISVCLISQTQQDTEGNVNTVHHISPFEVQAGYW